MAAREQLVRESSAVIRGAPQVIRGAILDGRNRRTRFFENFFAPGDAFSSQQNRRKSNCPDAE